MQYVASTATSDSPKSTAKLADKVHMIISRFSDDTQDFVQLVYIQQQRAPVITACTVVVQAVVKATSQSNGKGQILTPWGSETPERISMKLGIYNRVAGMATHANPCGAETSWVVWANT